MSCFGICWVCICIIILCDVIIEWNTAFCIGNIKRKKKLKAGHCNAAHPLERTWPLIRGDENDPFLIPEWKMWAHQMYNYTGFSLLLSLTFFPAWGMLTFPPPPQGQINTKETEKEKRWGRISVRKGNNKSKRREIQKRQSLFIANDDVFKKWNTPSSLCALIFTPALTPCLCILLWLTAGVHDSHS